MSGQAFYLPETKLTAREPPRHRAYSGVDSCALPAELHVGTGGHDDNSMKRVYRDGWKLFKKAPAALMDPYGKDYALIEFLRAITAPLDTEIMVYRRKTDRKWEFKFDGRRFVVAKMSNKDHYFLDSSDGLIPIRGYKRKRRVR